MNTNGTIETVSGDWAGSGGTEAEFSSTSHVVHNAPAYRRRGRLDAQHHGHDDQRLRLAIRRVERHLPLRRRLLHQHDAVRIRSLGLPLHATLPRARRAPERRRANRARMATGTARRRSNATTVNGSHAARIPRRAPRDRARAARATGAATATVTARRRCSATTATGSFARTTRALAQPSSTWPSPATTARTTARRRSSATAVIGSRARTTPRRARPDLARRTVSKRVTQRSRVWCAHENPRRRRLAGNRRPLRQVSAREGSLGDRVLAHALEARRHAPMR